LPIQSAAKLNQPSDLLRVTLIGVAPHVLGAGDALKVGYDRAELRGHANASLEYNDVAALHLAARLLPYDPVNRPPCPWLGDLALPQAVFVQPLRADRAPVLRAVALPETGGVRAHVAGLAEIPGSHPLLETACRAR